MKKSSKRFVISSEAKNSHGFRVRTSGVDLSGFNANPLLLFMHQRPEGKRNDEVLPPGYWEDLQLVENKITGLPLFDETDDFAMKLFNKVENNVLKSVSAGLIALEWSEIKGERWLEKSRLFEVSLCDIGSNKEAMAVVLYDEQEQTVTLSQSFNTQKPESKSKTDMKTIELSESTIGLLKLAEGDDATKAHAAVQELVSLTETQKGEIVTLKAEKEAAEKKFTDAEAAGKKAEMVALVTKAQEVDRKITKDQVPHYLKLAEEAPESTKALLASMPPNPTVASQIKTGGN